MPLSNMKHLQWRKIYLPEARCALGGDYCIHVKKGDPTRLVFHLCGGGISWSKESAKWPMVREVAETYGQIGLYTIYADRHPELSSITTGERNGLHSTTPENPFAEWSEVMVPYVTADFHTGRADFPFTGADGKEYILHHRGYDNLQIILKLTKELFPSVDHLLISGESAGAFGVSANAAEIMGLYPACDDITILADSSFVPCEEWAEAAKTIWNTPPHITAHLKTDNMALDWLRALYAACGDKPRYLFCCGNYDHTLIEYWHYTKDGRFLMDEAYTKAFMSKLVHMCRELKSLSPRFGIYIHNFTHDVPNPCVRHCIFGNACFTKEEVGNVTPAAWLKDASEDRIYDVGMELLEE